MSTIHYRPQEIELPPSFRQENRNRPHPNKSFLFWKQPRRYLDTRHSHAFRNDILQSFYEDYSTKPAIKSHPAQTDSDETCSIQVSIIHVKLFHRFISYDSDIGFPQP